MPSLGVAEAFAARETMVEQLPADVEDLRHAAASVAQLARVDARRAPQRAGLCGVDESLLAPPRVAFERGEGFVAHGSGSLGSVDPDRARFAPRGRRAVIVRQPIARAHRDRRRGDQPREDEPRIGSFQRGTLTFGSRVSANR
jgi:hypothetical protein